jgi:hypothetical protein
VDVYPSVRAFMAHLIDYAGLFPPARLPLPEAIQNYARYRQQPESWMLGRFIIPGTQLEFLTTTAARLFRENDVFLFSVLGRGGRDAAEFLDGLQVDLETIAEFHQQNEGKARVDVFEAKLPMLTSYKAIAALVSDAAKQLEDGLDLTTFYEVHFGPDWEPMAKATIQTIAEHNASHTDYQPVGFKLRCGGVEASAFPSPAQIAFALAECRDAHVALKATAGLHHPIRHIDDNVQTKMHGFLNVFGAGILAHVHDLDQRQIEAIVEDEDAAHFTFMPDAFAWQDLRATTEQIATIRARALITYGSCSFDEPRDDLAALGWLKRADAARR